MDNDDTSENNNYNKEAAALSQLIQILQGVSEDSRTRLLQTVITFFNIQPGSNIAISKRPSNPNIPVNTPVESSRSTSFSEDRSMSPKEFLLDKQPSTDVERVACLAYYLTHYRDTPHFKTIDISKLNTESAQRKFANAAKATANATRNEYLVPSTKGHRQLGAVGEVFVNALPDRSAARDAVAKLRPRKKRTTKKKIHSTL
ncbi:MAG: hypothetical protein RKH07_04705 [Gammaproteobacteria bacterium]